MPRPFLEIECPNCKRKNTVYIDEKQIKEGECICYGSACKTPCFHDLLPLALELEKKKIEDKS